MISLCPLPCSTIHLESRLITEKDSDWNTSAIILTFSDNVIITKTDFLKFNFMIFLADIGGSMGLWLGLGLLQVLEISMKYVCSRCRNKKKDEEIGDKREEEEG